MNQSEQAAKEWENRILKRAYRSSDLGPKDSVSTEFAIDLLEDYKSALKSKIEEYKARLQKAIDETTVQGTPGYWNGMNQMNLLNEFLELIDTIQPPK